MKVRKARKSVSTRCVGILLLGSLLAAGAGAGVQDEDGLDEFVLAEQVKATLLEKGGEAAVPIKVTMDGSTAILIGKVTSVAAEELATEVALSVDGVKDVDNRLKVAGAKSVKDMSAEDLKKKNAQELADAKLESSIKLALYKEIGLRARKIEVEASEGIVSLRGKVPDDARKQIALDTAGKNDDVKRVIDLIKVAG